MNENDKTIGWEDFSKIEMRVGSILRAEEFSEAMRPAYKLWVDFGEYGIRKSSAQITVLYELEELIGKKVVAVLNFPPKQIANFMSECLVLGAVDDDRVSLLGVDKSVENGLRIA
ncbi:tRNA-binding protein [Marivirga arenosa]|jgi:tRNA-binding protein|uniref:tRNA-binding protein n=1 Tax=Marivirga arenosa TaxID=3059076 RepID=A0AA52EY75_9BACT|nr:MULTISPECIES: tRNA-binding protein [unclassified Marivirga]WMN07836.1 tRNA-binding protein [Marivirga sp. ABR2-2]WNB17931.1 tRNA-binding protein [Marivirga sp. BKB1-2]